VFMVEELMEESMAPRKGHAWFSLVQIFFDIYLQVYILNKVL
jgi:hypothetical protein